MIDQEIHSSFVASRVDAGLADTAEAVERMAGQKISVGKATLTIGESIGDGFGGAAWFAGRLHTGSLLLPSVRVDVVVSPWSTTQSEIGIRPLGRAGSVGSVGSNLFMRAAWSVIESLIERVAATVTAAARPAVPVLQVAA